MRPVEEARGVSYIIIRKKGDAEPCGLCEGEVEIFDQEAAQARFLIVRMAARPFLGGGRCPRCEHCVCLTCATTTVYGAGQRRLHCPRCGSLLVGLRRGPGDEPRWGAFLEEPPEFSGQREGEAPKDEGEGPEGDEGGGVPKDDEES